MLIISFFLEREHTQTYETLQKRSKPAPKQCHIEAGVDEMEDPPPDSCGDEGWGSFGEEKFFLK